MITASLVTHTSIKDFMDMTIGRFYQVFVAIANVMEKRKR